VHEIHASQVDFESCEGESLSTKCLCCITEESHTCAEGTEEKEFEEIKGRIKSAVLKPGFFWSLDCNVVIFLQGH
jgi:hypothetical protein